METLVEKYWKGGVVKQKRPLLLKGVGVFFAGGDDWNRTNDTRIFSTLLYRLSYITSTFCDRSGDVSLPLWLKSMQR
jgi:hypothetical protein